MKVFRVFLTPEIEAGNNLMGRMPLHDQSNITAVENSTMSSIYPYVVRYDSGFAPNPFYGYCTLATCKPYIRQFALVGDWVIGTGSKTNKQENLLVYAMRVTETCDFDTYWLSDHFFDKRPVSNGSRKQRSGDNIYHHSDKDGEWIQEDSYHSHPDTETRQNHVKRDTTVNRVLISDNYYYYGGEGSEIPTKFRGEGPCKLTVGRSRRKITNAGHVKQVSGWVESLPKLGFCREPYRWRFKDD